MNDKTKKSAWLLVICYSCLGFCLPAPVTIFTMVNAELSAVFGCPTHTILMADSTRAVCLVIALFLSGYASRYLGSFRTILLGVSFQIVSQLLIPLAAEINSLPLLFVLKGMQGLNAIAFPVYISVIIRTVPSGIVGFSTAVFNGCFIAGAGAGALIAAQIIPRFGWQASFYIIALICLAFTIPALLVTPKDKALYMGRTNVRQWINSNRARPEGAYSVVIKNPVTWLLVLAFSANTWVMQTVIVDMPVYTKYLQIPYDKTGNLMFMISIITVSSSIVGGFVSDRAAMNHRSPLRIRAYLLAFGLFVSALAVMGLVFIKDINIIPLSIFSALMVFGVSWAAGIFWSLPALVYPEKDTSTATAFCAGAANVVNPIAPLVAGVLLGSAGFWQLGWFTCFIVCALGFAAAVVVGAKGN